MLVLPNERLSYNPELRNRFVEVVELLFSYGHEDWSITNYLTDNGNVTEAQRTRMHDIATVRMETDLLFPLPWLRWQAVNLHTGETERFTVYPDGVNGFCSGDEDRQAERHFVEDFEAWGLAL